MQQLSPGIYLRGMKTCIHTEACTQMFMAAFFVVAPKLDQPRCPYKSEWLNCGTYKPWNTTQAEKGMSH